MSSKQSPDNSSPGFRDLQAGPSKRPRNTVLDAQRHQIEKLLANPDKEVILPTGLTEKVLRPPREMMKNVQGSSAGAGSGEFHVYKQSRRREYERLKMMEEKIKSEEEHAAFMERQAERDTIAEAKTSKNRAKRQKRKQGRKGGSAGVVGGSANDERGVVKRKLEGDAKITFRKPGEEGSQSEEDEEDVLPMLPVEVKETIIEIVPDWPVAEEATIRIVDEN
ncbi:uncharacterized protein L203_102048 [Cryptococcus depauperatus CBS 7841]|uniref:Uncharacterized protein n=1 Tax=Cryptococcus depauperatus CBS 7841 TaxID=1295531 RepID=A0A1E3IRD6_9TREE|nr:hypothetical protein L203_01300 [Cryptococcus depauperatus CBS 7841]